MLETSCQSFSLALVSALTIGITRETSLFPDESFYEQT